MLKNAQEHNNDLLQNTVLKLISPTQLVNEFFNILDTITDGIMITDADNNIIIVNKHHALLEFLDYDDIIGHSAFEMMENGYCQKLTPFTVEELKKTKQPYSLKMSTLTGRELIVTGIPLLDKNNDVNLIIYTSQDITQFEKIRQDLERESSLRTLFENQANSTIEKNVVFFSKPMVNIYDTITKIAKTDSTVFLMGESGVGKDVIAKKIHDLSPRKDHSFIHINCASIPETLLESEFFGYVAGAFTGALKKGKPGLFELSDGGTLYLDEITETQISFQAKLLQVLQHNVFRRVGSIDDIHLNARVIASTNKDIFRLMETGGFRADLYYRLCVVPINIPPLRKRTEDIPRLATIFLSRLNQKYSTQKFFSDQFMDYLTAYDWPGNVRELENLVERAYITADGECIDLSESIVCQNITINNKTTLKEATEQLERTLIAKALSQSSNTRSAAEIVGVSQATFLRKAHRYGFDLS